ncbi:hypothetical protein VT84_14790 [Gemmata sp. SH-PL17]|uniref:hypothetical protein n=1 Tax=Gemmata sp. SH-PL17 TaxID=1630693 RepID=UPI00078D9577|nr:hypothetical protein [Gemmata sp. SH-PL17]AMV25662.1 hypothetical protein VT84_14790 [Gemmata sp. SH-PL17]
MLPPNSFPEAEPGIDELVRAQLDAEATRIDGREMADRLLTRLAAGAEPVRGGRSWRRVASVVGFVGLAAAVLIAVVTLSGPREVVASPAQVVRGARDAYTRTDTRCYRVTIELPPRLREAFPLLALDTSPRILCTRGDRFYVQPGFGGRGSWGSDGSGRVWVAPTTEGAVAFDESELPVALRNAVKIHELEVGSLLDEVLADFDLTWAEPPARDADTYSVTAVRRGDVRPLQIASAELVIEKQTKVVRSLVVRRKALGEGTTAFTFELIETVSKDDAAFNPEGHIKPGAPVYDRTKPNPRRRLLIQQIGEIVFRGM